MQTMSRACLLAALCGISGVGALSTGIVANRATTAISAAASTLSQEWKAGLLLEAEDTHFWSSEWQAMESELLQLQAEAAGKPANATANIATPKASAKNSTHLKSPKNPRHYNPLAGLKLNLDPKTPADLLPALAMLKGLYEDGKERIGKLNARETKSKTEFEQRQVKHEQRLATIAAKAKNGTLSKEFVTNETRDENHLWTYWQHVRERQHRQYHTSLKIQHSTLSKEKAMIDMYEKTIAGKESKKQLAGEFAKVGGPAVAPEVYLLQETRQAVVQFCQAELTEVRTSQAALLQTDFSARHDSAQLIE